MIQSHEVNAAEAASYDAVAGPFAGFADRYTTPLAEYLVSLGRVGGGASILDVGTGSGIVALKAAELFGPQCDTVGIDLSHRMLEQARNRAARCGHSIKFQIMDAESLQFENRSFDVVLSLFALTHFPNPLTAVREMHRVLRPGGTLVVGVGSCGALRSFRGCFETLRRLTDRLLERAGRRLIAPDSLNALVRRQTETLECPEETTWSRKNSNRGLAVLKLVRQAGFVDVQGTWWGCTATVDTAEEFWDLQTTFSTFARKRLALATPETVNRIRRQFIDSCNDVQRRDGKLVYPFAAGVVSARRSM